MAWAERPASRTPAPAKGRRTLRMVEQKMTLPV
jgi:hypothetical protein